MVITNWESLFMLMVFAPAVVAFVNVDAFFVLTSILILLISSKSLKQLIVANFGSDAMFERMQQENYLKSNNSGSKKLDLTIVFLLNFLFIIFFVYTYFISGNVFLKIAAIIVSANWVFDLIRTINNSIAFVNPEREWTVRDTLAEVFMWIHNVSTIAFVIIAFGVKFF